MLYAVLEGMLLTAVGSFIVLPALAALLGALFPPRKPPPPPPVNPRVCPVCGAAKPADESCACWHRRPPPHQ